ncbi:MULTISPECIES: hypothetical protein [Sulfitobacter]|jgi:hypothetical protein|uniref:Sulfotransferase domain-containing protein n=1 Tax=Sulfitobacter dubius TaxID=218673 RepID=A0ABY3ZL18_9RHOB|nr:MULTISPECIES: hypothetical protein [Sulfitobacter]UOA15192.1 hypothetical protein DSM109990_02012 [Sulfitobacter dubius]UOA32144.1 hypothetical protein DSM110093_01926 [Sulfitobacter sp. DSM 110093]WOI29392.1 hypothetical protein R1T39_01400 [Sulfitobacter dubius]
MQLVLHTGVHFTEDERLLKCLLRNQDDFAKAGIRVPGPSTYRNLFRDTLNAMHKTEPSDVARDVLLDAILDDGKADRVILSDANFFRSPATALKEGVLYPAAAVRMRRMTRLFPDDEISIFMAIRNPASLVPMLYEKAADKTSAAFWGERGPTDLRWSETIQQLREMAPEIPITVWCNEDTPLIWAQIIREMAELAPETKIKGGFDLLQSIMSEEGMRRFRGYVDTHPEMSEAQKRRVIIAFLDKYALEEEIEEELDMPGWTEELVEQMTALYDADVEIIRAMPGVTLIAP